MKSQQHHVTERMKAVNDASPAPTRRRLILTGVAGAAATAGAMVAWEELASRPASPALLDQFWRMSFDTTDGKTIETPALRGRPLLVNFWATWCPPCIEELPMLDAFFRTHAAQGWQVLGLAVDQPGAVRKFLVRTPLSFPIALAGLQGTSLSRGLGNEAGGLPFSIMFDTRGEITQRRMGRLSPEELKSWANELG